MQATEPFRCGYVSVAGLPNVGKSTLLNRLVGSRLAIVSPRPQTTRATVRGILTTGTEQIIFIDTAGIHTPRDRLGGYMVESARQSFLDADLIYLLIEPRVPGEPELEVFAQAAAAARPVFLIINKIDTVQKESLLPIIAACESHGGFAEIIPVSAATGDNTDLLLDLTRRRLPAGSALYPSDVVSDQIEREFLSEYIRERLYFNTHDEIPYSTAVVIEDMQERAGGGAYIRASIIVEKESQKGILIGRAGSMIKKIGTEARRSIEQFLGYSVHLDLQVKVEKKWRDDPSSLRKIGYGRG
jgi:GTPase